MGFERELPEVLDRGLRLIRVGEMETVISTFCKTLATLCNHIESTTRDLSESIERRPVPLVSAASAFLQSLDRRISSTNADLNLLESMALGTVSFEELIGHCNEVYKTNQKYIDHIEDRMKSFGYIPELELDDGDGICLDSEFISPGIGSKRLDFTCGSVSAMRSNRKKFEEDLLFQDSLSLQNLGLSDACLATLASEDNDYSASPIISSQNAISHVDIQAHNSTASFQPPIDVSTSPDGDSSRISIVIKILKDDYDNLPSYMRSLASWEEMQEAVDKLNNYICKKGATECYAIDQHDLEALALGHKGRSYLLLLLSMKQLVVETVNGSIQYRPCVS